MPDPRSIAVILAAVLLALGLWLLLPRGGRPGRRAGAVAACLGLALLAARMPGFGEWVSQSIFGRWPS